MKSCNGIESLDDTSLTHELGRLLGDERNARTDFLLALAEFDKRRLHLEHGFASLFVFLTDSLKMSKGSAYRRMTACRLLARLPSLTQWLRDGRLSLAKLCLLKDVLSEDNHVSLAAKAVTLSETEVEALALSLQPGRPEPRRREAIRPLRRRPTRSESAAPSDTFASPCRDPNHENGSMLEPQAIPVPRPVPTHTEHTHSIEMPIYPEFLAQLERVRSALSHTHPGATMETLLSECMRVFLAQHEKRVQAKVKAPRPPRNHPHDPKKSSRYVPAAVRREVFERCQGKCSFVSEAGKRCSSDFQLEIHHRIPYAQGGLATVENLTLRCKGHNLYAAEKDFGRSHMDLFRNHSLEPPRPADRP